MLYFMAHNNDPLNMNYTWQDFLGNLGVLLIIASYLALQLERVSSTSLAYSATNAVGAIFVIVSLVFKFNLSAFVMELFWLLISLFGIAKVWLRHTKST